MLVQRAYKIELDPNNAQRTLLARHAGVARFVYNWGLARRIEQYAACQKVSNAIEQHRELVLLKAGEFRWMREVSSIAPQSALRDLDKAFARFFRLRKAGDATSLPKFRSKRRGSVSFRLCQDVTVKSRRIRLPRLGWLRLKEADYLPVGVKINSVTVRQRAGRWFVSIQVEEEIAVPENQGPAIGLDLGIKAFAVGSDGGSLVSPMPLNRNLKRLRSLSRRVSRKQKGSKNRKKTAAKLVRLHYRIGCQRQDFLHKATAALVRANSVIVVEDLNVQGLLQNRKLSRSIHDSSWSEFIRQLEYKCSWYGSRLVKADRFFPSTKTCSGCGEVKDAMPLKLRTYYCDGCGLTLDRDLNAARNLVKLSTASSAGFQACGDLPAGAVCEAGTEHGGLVLL